MSIQNPKELIRILLSRKRESEWVEFKVNNFSPDSVGRYISGLANSALFCSEETGYLVFGIDDQNCEIVGTNINISTEMVGNDTFLFWLSKQLLPRVTVENCRCEIEGKIVEILAVSHGYQHPVKFKSISYVRIDTSLQPLSNYPDRERAIWQASSRFTFEQSVVKSHVDSEYIIENFAIFSLLDSLSVNRQSNASIVEYLEQEGFVKDNRQGGFDINNLLPLAAANDISKFPGLERKGSRVIVYRDKTKINSLSDTQGKKGYAVSFNSLLDHIMKHLNPVEEMAHGIRQIKYNIPKIAIREIVANAIIHQDFMASGDGPLIEVFPDKVKITNPGKPLIPTDRFIDSPSRSRNVKFGNLMRRLGLCEERGSGIDRALAAIERAVLPAPMIQQVEDTTVVTLFCAKQFADMSKEDRIRACYQHACLCIEKNEPMSNSSFRARLGLSDKQYPQASIIIAEAKEAGVIRAMDEEQAKRNARYVPYWY